MNILPSDDKPFDVFEHIKTNWAESIILVIFAVALLFMALSTSVTYG